MYFYGHGVVCRPGVKCSVSPAASQARDPGRGDGAHDLLAHEEDLGDGAASGDVFGLDHHGRGGVVAEFGFELLQACARSWVFAGGEGGFDGVGRET